MLAAPTAPTRDRLLVVDDHELVRLGLSTLIASCVREGAAPVQVLEARTLAQALDCYAVHGQRIARVLLDLHLPDAHGLGGLRRFLACFPDASVAVLSGNTDPALIREALREGALAYLPKSGDLNEVIDYVRGCGLFGAPALASDSRVVDGDARLPGRTVHTLAGEAVRLTSRQANLLDGLLAGESNRQIAERLCLSEGTVKNHVSTLLLTFGVRSRAQLISALR